jgi:hypothetical protein
VLDGPLTKAQLKALVDPQGRNLSVSSADKLSSFARKYLLANTAKRFVLAADDRQFYDFLFALRNHLAHRSSFARSVLIKTIKAFANSVPNQALYAAKPKVESYLTEGAIPRMKTIYSRTRTLAGHF